MTNCHDVEYEAAAANVQEMYLQNKNRSKKEIIEKRDPKTFSIGEKIIVWQHAFHAGEGFGLKWQIPVFLV